ncbi:PilW family protein [Variovorax sp. M-6]|uniref:PilW family protein n=1 Tax=Variovorax sp. M-6 TaxID=3233041 RepID=UPI003F96479B
MSTPDARPGLRRRQRGLSLIELLAGMAIGLLVIATAFGTLLLARSAAASVSELGQLQQQGSYALHVIGQQFRQAGSLEPVRDETTGLHAFATEAAGSGNAAAVVSGTQGADGAGDSVSVAVVRARWPAASGSQRIWAQYDCIGANVETENRISATFSLDAKGQLTCRSAKGLQPVIGNVADFRVSYRVDTGSGIQAMDAGAVQRAKLWSAVTAIEVCLDLEGSEISAGAFKDYRGCAETDKPRAGRTHLVFRNLFHLRTR